MNTEQEFELNKSKISNEELIGLAHKEIGELAKSYGKSHKMSIPPRITDTDMLLTEVVKRFEVAQSQTEALKKEIEELKKNTLLSLFEDFVEWASKQFPNSTMESSLIGLDREISEVILAKADYTVIDCEENRTNLGIEYVDCIMYLIDSMKRAGFEISELPSLFAQKLEINKKREWKQNKDKSYSHITPPKQ